MCESKETILVEVGEEIDTEVGESIVLTPGEYQIYVPDGQRAIVTYEIDLSTTPEPQDDGEGVVFNANEPGTQGS